MFQAAKLTSKSKSKPLSIDKSASLVKEIQAIIISQELQTKNRRKLAKLGKQHAHQFLSDPKLNEHNTVDEKFQKKPFTSLAIDLYKSKLLNKPLRQESAVILAEAAAHDRENVPNSLASLHHSDSRLRVLGPDPYACKTFDRKNPGAGLLPAACQTR